LFSDAVDGSVRGLGPDENLAARALPILRWQQHYLGLGEVVSTGLMATDIIE